jgi:hydroxypyruvate isomerase
MAAAMPAPAFPQSEKKPLSRRLSIMIGGFYGKLPLLERLDKLASIKYPAFEGINWQREDLDAVREKARALNLDIVHIGGSRSLTGPVGAMVDPAERDNFLSYLRTAIQAAKRLGTKRLLVLTGNELPNKSIEEQRQSIIDGLKAARPLVEPEGITLVVELLNTLVNHPGYYLHSSLEGVRIVDAVGSPNIKLLNDLYHMQIMEGNLIANLTKYIDRIGHFHVGDVPGRHQPGTGEVNWRNVFEAIAKTNYQGYVAMEYNPTIDYLESLKQIQQMTADL